MTGVDARLQRLLGGEQLAPLRMRLRQRFERQRADEMLGQIRLVGLTPHERSAIASLTGSPTRTSKSISIDVVAVDAALSSAGLAATLREALESLDGPIVHLATARAEEVRRWDDVATLCSDHRLAPWVLRPANLGLLKRLSRNDPTAATVLCRAVDAVLGRLPASGITRAQLAAELLGDAHALDTGQAVATVALSVLRSARDPDPDGTEAEDERARNVWASAGVLVNELARPALFLNVPFEGAEGHAPHLGQPQFASLRWLLRAPPRWRVQGRNVYVCENPNVVAIAADCLGALCLPLVCTDGMPAAAQRVLLAQLVAADARLLYHGDFDWGGLRIANHVLRAYAASLPWRMSDADYRLAVNRPSLVRNELRGAPVVARWDQHLSTTMAKCRAAIAEEAVVDTLLEDLGALNAIASSAPSSPSIVVHQADRVAHPTRRE